MSTRLLNPPSPRLLAVIFDWAGTVVDFGSRAPVQAFVELFHRHGVALSVEQVRGPMGMHKREHIRQLLLLPDVAASWAAVHGQPSTGQDLDTLYAEFIPLQTGIVTHYGRVIPGVPELMQALGRRGIRTGSTTGYTRAMMAALIPAAARQGFAPEAIVCADEVPAGRPAPWLALEALKRLNAYPVSACVKVGDTVADIDEGFNAGLWTVGVLLTGNETGLSEEELAALDAPAREACRSAAGARLLQAGAHFVIDSAADLLPTLDLIEDRLAHGQRP
ncbi:MAG: phosphonoacetaldehyde hydrolase [Bryobacteraceae bacterium]